MGLNLGQFPIVRNVREVRFNQRVEREVSFKDEIKKILDRLVNKTSDCEAISERVRKYLNTNIYFNRDIDKIKTKYCELIDSFGDSTQLLTVSDIDGVLVHPFYFIHRLDKKGYPDLINKISNTDQQIILFSNRFEIPAWIYSLVINTKFNHLFAGSYENQMGLFLPDDVVKYNGVNIPTSISKNSSILVKMMHRDAVIDFKEKTIAIPDLSKDDPKKVPTFTYLNKKNKETRRQCMSKIFYNLLFKKKVIFIGSSTFDRHFYLELLDYLGKKYNEYDFEDNEKPDFLQFISNLFYLDSNLSVV